MSNRLSPMQDKLLATLSNGDDVTIRTLYFAVHGAPKEPKTNRSMQQRLGPLISRVNGKLPIEMEIVPGALKGTYRLITRKG